MTMKIILSVVILASYPFSLELLQADEIEDIIVTSTRGQPIDKALPVAIRVITRDQIRLSGALNLADLMRSTGSIQVSDLYGGGYSASIGIRGFTETAPQNTLVMIDGRRLNNIDNGLLDFSAVGIEQIDRIEILKGSAGALYGDKAVGGIINIITRSPQSLDLETSVELGSYDRKKFHAAVVNNHQNGIFYGLRGSRELSDNYRVHNRYRNTNLSLKAGYRHALGELQLFLQNVDDNIQAPGALFADQLHNDRRQAANPGDYINSDIKVARLGIEQELVERFMIQAEAAWREKSVTGTLSSGGVPSSFTQYREHAEITPRLIFNDAFSGLIHRFTLGADLFTTEYNITSPFGITDDTQLQAGVYAQSIFNLTDTITLSLGARHSQVSNDIFVDTLAFGRSLEPGTEIDDSANAWEAGISWQYNNNWRLYARIDRNFRFVTADEYSAVADSNFFSGLFGAGLQTPVPVTQTGLSYEAGVEWSTSASRTTLDVFHLSLENEIVFDPSVFLNTNIGSTARTGVTVETEFMPSDNWTIGLSYSYIDARVTSGQFDNTDLTFIPEHTLKLSSSYQLTESLSAYIEFNTTSEQVLGGDFSGSLPALPGYEVLNLNIIYDKQPIELSFRVNNLLNVEYSEYGNAGFDYRSITFPRVATYFPAPGRNFSVSLTGSW